MLAHLKANPDTLTDTPASFFTPRTRRLHLAKALKVGTGYSPFSHPGHGGFISAAQNTSLLRPVYFVQLETGPGLNDPEHHTSRARPLCATTVGLP